MSHDENMRRAGHAYDNLTPEDFGPGFSERDCDRCQMSRLADELQYDEDHNLYVCGGCLAYGDHSADGDEWRRCCEDCGELFGASLVTGKEDEDVRCELCREEAGAIEALTGMIDQLGKIERRISVNYHHRPDQKLNVARGAIYDAERGIRRALDALGCIR